jgi:hypothetical protein
MKLLSLVTALAFPAFALSTAIPQQAMAQANISPKLPATVSTIIPNKTGDSVQLSVTPGGNTLRYNAALNLTSCQFISKSQIGPTKVGTTQVDDGRLTLRVTILEKATPCNRNVSLTTFRGYYGPYASTLPKDQLLAKLNRLEFVVDRPLPWYESVNFQKLDWKVGQSDSIALNGFTLQMKGEFQSVEGKKCLSSKLQMGKYWCKYALAIPPKGSKMAIKKITDVPTLLSFIGPIKDLPSLQFFQTVTNGNGWNFGQLVFKDNRGDSRLLALVQRECASEFEVLEISAFDGTKKSVAKFKDATKPVICQ